MVVMGRHAITLTEILNYAEKIHASRVTVTGYRAKTLLSDDTVMTEKEGLDRTRADEVADLLKRGGLTGPAIEVSYVDEPG